MMRWIDRTTALAQLGVKPQTLYAYVSRGRIRMAPDPDDGRRSLYSAEDVSTLTTRRARGRKPETIAASSMAWGEPAIATGLSAVHRGRFFYRGADAVGLARTSTLEEIAALLWDASRPVTFPASGADLPDAFQAIAAVVGESQPILGRGGDTLVRDAEAIVSRIAAACGAANGTEALHLRLARGWRCGEAVSGRLRQALVLMADHDLNASTFAARIAASTGASLPSCVLAGLCALSGPRHGGAAAALKSLIEEARRMGAAETVRRWLDREAALPGFGHPLYPDGDPRAELMLEGLAPQPSLWSLRDTVFDLTGSLPNCDFALAAMVDALGLPADAPFRIFLLGRSIGWCAHAMEQNRTGALIRPRGRYEGALPE